MTKLIPYNLAYAPRRELLHTMPPPLERSLNWSWDMVYVPIYDELRDRGMRARSYRSSYATMPSTDGEIYRCRCP